jgi:hypothetical protein
MSESQADELRLTSSVSLIVRLRLEERVALDPSRVPAILGIPEAPWLGEPTHSEDGAMRAYLCDLELHAGGAGPAIFRKAAIVSLGQPILRDAGWMVPIEWRAATLSPLFPVLVGSLHVDAERVALDGRYAPPGGRLGYQLDVRLFGAAARQTGHWFLRRVAAALTSK